jgi:hypothetical protein
VFTVVFFGQTGKKGRFGLGFLFNRHKNRSFLCKFVGYKR